MTNAALASSSASSTSSSSASPTSSSSASSASPTSSSASSASPTSSSASSASSPTSSLLAIDLQPGLAATGIDAHLRRASRGRDISNRIMAFYFDELHESRKYRDLGYTCLAQYADQRLGFEPRRARELCQAGRALVTLSLIDRACRDGRLCWTKTELLTHGVQEHQQEEWLERALGVGCSELRQMLQRHRKGLSAEKTTDGGLPQSEISVDATISAARFAKFERVREDLMRRRGTFIDDSEVLGHIMDEHEVPELDVARESERAVACEQEETPDWLRRKVLARDGHRCQACGTSTARQLHAHHIVFRSRGGLTQEDNLTSLCAACHGLIHEGRLFAKGLPSEGVEFHNRFGEPLVTAGSLAAALPQPVLQLLRDDVLPCDVLPRRQVGSHESGGQPPRRFSSGVEIPDIITGEWFKEHIHLFEPGRDGVWRLIKPARAT